MSLELLNDVRRLEKYIIGLPLSRNRNLLNREQRDVMNTILDNMALARKQIEYSLGDEDVEAQLKGFTLSIDELQVVHKGLLHSSIQDDLSAVDVPQLSSLTEHCIDSVKQIIRKF